MEISQDIELASRHEDERSLLLPHAANPSISPGGVDLVHNSKTRWYLKPSPHWIPPVLFGLNGMSSMIMAPMMQLIIQMVCDEYFEKGGGDAGSSIDKCTLPQVQGRVANIFMAFGLCGAIASTLVAGYYGSLSDKRGRKLVLCLGSIGNIIDMIGLLIVSRYWKTIGVASVFVTTIISNLFGSGAAFVSAAYAYTTDVTTANERSVAFGRMFSGALLGAVFGPTLGAVIIQRTGSILSVIYFNLFSTILFLLFFAFILPEKPRVPKRAASPATSESPIMSLFNSLNIFSALSIFFRSHTLPSISRSGSLPILALIYFIYGVCITGLSSIFVLYTSLVYDWTTWEDGIFLSYQYFMKFLALVVLLPWLNHRFKSKEDITQKMSGFEQPAVLLGGLANDIDTESLYNVRINTEDEGSDGNPTSAVNLTFDVWMLRLGLALDMLSFAGYGIAGTPFIYYGASILQSAGVIASPSLRSLFTHLVPASETGTVLGALSIMDSIAGIVSPVLVTTIYSHSVTTMPNLAYLLAAMVMALAVTLAMLVGPPTDIWRRLKGPQYANV